VASRRPSPRCGGWRRPGIYGVVNFPDCEPGDDRFFEAALSWGFLVLPRDVPHAASVAAAGVDVDLSKVMNATGCIKYMLSGVLDRLPDLTIFCAETFCGWLAYAYQQVDSWYENYGLWVDADLQHLPSEYMKRHFRWSFIVDPLAIRLRHMIGIENFMWSTDFPHMNTDWPESRRSIDEQMGDIPDVDRRRIIRDNAVELFKLPAAT
jgi:predicted TIM-barrel fold metal-dependent hydrolase